MKKDSTMTVGLDLGDRKSQVIVLDEGGEVVEESTVPTTRAGIGRKFTSMAPCRMAIEVGTHARWVAQLLRELEHEVVVANPRKLRMIYQNESKSDRMDALMLARVARLDPALLHGVVQRSQRSQDQLAVVKARAVLVGTRTKLVNHVRGVCKACGTRLSGCSSATMSKKAGEQIPEALRSALDPLLQILAEVTERIREYDRAIKQMAQKEVPEAGKLTQIPGVGALTALAFVLTLDEEGRFQKSRTVGAYLGLRPRRDQSGATDKQLPVTKAGDVYLRSLLVNCAHHILGPFGTDCAIRRWGLNLAERGGKNAKKRAVVATARKLAVVMHRMWVTGEVFIPFPEPARRPHSLQVAG